MLFKGNSECVIPEIFRTNINHRNNMQKSMKLNYQKMVRIIKRKEKKLSSAVIAKQFNISKKRIEQVWAYYCKHKTYLPLKRQGRKTYRRYSSNLIHKILELHKKYRFGATYIAKYLRDKEGIKIGHDFVHKLLIENKMAIPNKNKKKRRKL